jgi:hypothetical protein
VVERTINGSDPKVLFFKTLLDAVLIRVINFYMLEQSKYQERRRTPMIMNKFFITTSLTGKAGGVDFRSAPALR